MDRTHLHVPRLAAAFALGCGVALLLGTSGSATATSTRATFPSERSAHNPGGAAAAATIWTQTSAEAFVDGGWNSAVDALAIGTFRALALSVAPAAALVHRRLVAARTPFALRVWPLGYQIEEYSPLLARVRVWQLYVFAIAAPEADTEFTTTTVALRWTGGAWKVTAAPPGPDLAPPGGTASAHQVSRWVGATNALERYRYVP